MAECGIATVEHAIELVCYGMAPHSRAEAPTGRVVAPPVPTFLKMTLDFEAHLQAVVEAVLPLLNEERWSANVTDSGLSPDPDGPWICAGAKRLERLKQAVHAATTSLPQSMLEHRLRTLLKGAKHLVTWWDSTDSPKPWAALEAGEQILRKAIPDVEAVLLQLDNANRIQVPETSSEPKAQRSLTAADAHALSLCPKGWFTYVEMPVLVRRPEYRLDRLHNRGWLKCRTQPVPGVFRFERQYHKL